MTDILRVKGPRKSGTTWALETIKRAYEDHPEVIVRESGWRHGTFEEGSPPKEVAVVREPFGWTLSYHGYLNQVREANSLYRIMASERTPEEVRAWVERWCRKVEDWQRQATEAVAPGETADKLLVRYWDLLAYQSEAFEAVATTLGLPQPPHGFVPPANRVDSGGREKPQTFDRDYWLDYRYVDELPVAFIQGCARALRQNREVVKAVGYDTEPPEVQA